MKYYQVAVSKETNGYVRLWAEDEFEARQSVASMSSREIEFEADWDDEAWYVAVADDVEEI